MGEDVTSSALSYAIIGARILSIDGIIDYSELTVNTLTANISCEENEVFIVKEVILLE